MLQLNPSIGLLASIGIALLYKLYKLIKIRSLAKTYFHDKTVLVTGASQGLGKGKFYLIYGHPIARWT